MTSTEQQLREELRASEERLSFVVEAAGLGTWDWDLRTGTLACSERCLEMFGIPAATEMTYERFLAALHPEERGRVDQAVRQNHQHKSDYSLEMRAVWPDGSIHWIMSRGRAYFDPSGQPVRMSGAALDITRSKQAEEDLKQARAESKAHADNLASVLDTVPALTFFCGDRECRTMTAGRQAREFFDLQDGVNVSMSAPEGRALGFVWLEDGQEVAPERLPVQQAAASGREVRNKQLQVRFPDGRVHDMFGHAVPLFDAAGAVQGAVGALLDITELKKTEVELERARAEAKAQAENLSAIFDAMPAAAFFSHDRKCERVTSNRAAYELLRMPYGSNLSMSAPPEELPTFRIYENGREIPAEELPLQKAAMTGQPVRDKEFEIRFEDGSSMYEFGHAEPLFDENGGVRGAVGAFLDVTDRKVMEERLRTNSERFKVALRGTPITVFNQDLDLRYRWIHNPVGLHQSTFEIIGKRDSDLLERAEDWKMTEAIKREVLRTGISYQGEMTVSMKGEPRHYHVRIDPQHDAQGRICGLTGASFDWTQQRREEEEREKLSQQRQLALDAARMAWWHYDATAKVSTWDDTFKSIFGMTANSLPAEEVLKLVRADDLPRLVEQFKKDFDAAEPKAHFGEYRIVRADGSVRWVEIYAAAEFRPDGAARKFVSCSGTLRDITGRKQQQQELRASEQRYRTLFETMTEGFAVCELVRDDKGQAIDIRWLECNSAIEALTGLRRDEVVGHLASEVFPAEYEWWVHTYERVVREKTVQRFEGGSESAGRIWDLTAFPYGNDRFAVLYQDITARKRAEEALRQQRERSEFVAESSDIGFWFCDLPFEKLIWDKRVKQHFWLSAETEPVTIDMFYELIHPDDREPTRRAIENSIQNNLPYHVEYRTVARDGRERWVRANGKAWYDASGKPVRFDGITQDITVPKRMQEALRASEGRYRELAAHLDEQVQERTKELKTRNEDLQRSAEQVRRLTGRLLQLQDNERRRIARELHDSSGQILTAIGIDLANVAEQAKSKAVLEAAPDLLRRVEETEELVQRLHRELRTTSYLLHPPLLDEAGLSSAVGWYVQGVSQRSGIEINFDISTNFGRLSRDLELVVFRIVQESLTNILRHSGAKQASIGIARLPEAITVEIEDSGKGIPPEKLAAVQSGAAGLGIRALRERLRPFNGELQIASGDSGTHIVVTIPQPQPAASEQVEPARAAM